MKKRAMGGETVRGRVRAKSYYRWLAAGGALAGLLLAFGCGHRSPVIGAWQGSMDPLGQFTIEFKPDGTLKQVSNGGMVEIDGTYSASGDRLTTTEDSASVAGRSVPVPPSSSFLSNCTYAVNGANLILSSGTQSVVLTRTK